MSKRDDLERQLLEQTSAVSTSSIGRLGRTAAAALRSRRIFKGSAKGEVDPRDVAELVSSVGRLKGIAMKMSQIMSYIDVALPPELREGLAVLQTHSQPMPFESVRKILEVDLGKRAAEILQGMEPVPVAAASIGQVHRAILPDGARVAVKVQYPEIEAAITSDFRPAAMGTGMANLIYPGADVSGMIREARERFLAECDYGSEAGFQESFGRIFAGHALIRVPEVHRVYSSRHVLTTSWVDGHRFDAYLASQPEAGERDRLGVALFEFYVDTLFRHGLYNCDPHPGNYLFVPGGTIAVLDYGCCRAFEPAFIDKLSKLTLAVHADDRDQLHQAFVGLGMVRDGKKYDFATARDLVRSFYGPMLVDREQVIEPGQALGMNSILKNKRQLMKLKLPGEFLFLFRIRFGLMAVLAQLGARANWYRLERACVEGLDPPSR